MTKTLKILCRSLLVLLVSTGTSFADDAQVWDPIGENILRLQAKTGIVVTYEIGPTAHLQEPVLGEDGLPIEDHFGVVKTIPERRFPMMSAASDTRASVLHAMQQAADSRPGLAGWDGCTRYSVAETPFGLHVAPTHVVVAGQCVPYLSPLDRRVGEGQANLVVRGGQSLARVLREQHITFHGMGIEIRFPADGSGLSAREILEAFQANDSRVTWSIFESPKGGHYILKVFHVGENVDHLDPADYPHHSAHAVEARMQELGLTWADIEARNQAQKLSYLEALERARDEGQAIIPPASSTSIDSPH